MHADWPLRGRRDRVSRFRCLLGAVTLLLTGGPIVVGLAQQAAGAPTPAAITIENEAFQPVTLTVAAGTTVTWTSRDDDPHTVTSTENVFASAGLEKDDTYSYTFTTAGTYPYYCKLHPHMTGTIVVK